jgi:hypothetical protein
LRYGIMQTGAGSIVFDTPAINANTPGACDSPNGPCEIILSGPLPAINSSNLTIDGGTFGTIIIDGASTYRAFWVNGGTVTIKNLQIQDVTAKGGNGGAGSGGGAGLGGGLFVYAGNVSVVNDFFVNCIAQGGAGGSAGNGGFGGGGGMGGNGGSFSGSGSMSGGSGGGGLLSAGANANNANGVTGGSGYLPTGGAGGTPGQSGGNGGVGGGGGGGGYSSTTPAAGGNGGFGGGGGGASTEIAQGGGLGGFGGGGGAGAGGGNGGQGGGGASGYIYFGIGYGKAIGSTVMGGNGSFDNLGYTSGNGGGGGAAGPAIFVYAGSLQTTNSGATACSAIPGVPGSAYDRDMVATAGTADATPVYNYGGTVNGGGGVGPFASALSASAPTGFIRKRRNH